MTEKMKMQTDNLTQSKITKLAELFPDCITEVTDSITGKTKLSIDIKLLKDSISENCSDGESEKYQFTWPGKREAKNSINKPITKTLRPIRSKSIDYEKTKNLYIEGDNLDALKILRETYLHKIKVIYIDPPYNTGNDFIYDDDFSESIDEFSSKNGLHDEYGNRMVKNANTDGRYHTNWLNMIYPRLLLAKDFLTEDGVIFISIDSCEFDNLKKCCNEIFGEGNYIAEFIVASNSSKNNANWVSVSHEYVLCFARNKNKLDSSWSVKKNNVDEFVKRANQLLSSKLSKEEIHKELLELTKKPRFYDLDHYSYADERGVYRTDNAGGVTNGNFKTEIIHPITHKECKKPIGGWRYKEEEIKRKIENGEFEFGIDETVIPVPKRYLKDYMYQVPKSILFFDSQSSTKWLKSNNLPFDYPKSIDLIKYIISMIPNVDYVMDFFSGSATTADAVLRLNAEDGGNRKFILVQIPEQVNKKSNSSDDRFTTICDIGRERIKIIGEELSEKCDGLDVGYRTLRIDSSNMKDVYYTPENIHRSDLEQYMENIKEDRSSEDVLFQVMLELGIELSSKITTETIDGKEILSVDDGFLIACLDENITENVITEVSRRRPVNFVMRDRSAINDSTSINFEQIFKSYSPETNVRVI